MDILWKICLGIICLPLFFIGLNIVLQFVYGTGIGLFSFFGMIWDRQEKLSPKQGIVFGGFYVLLQLLLGFISTLFFSNLCNLPRLTSFLFNFFGFLPLVVLVVSLIRGKFIFGFLFFLVTQFFFLLFNSFL